ncbi:MAG: 16S/23S rRNA (cytidine-2'-O)-methyltransferase TlyA [Acidimicrobiia bacterium]|nr:MAG: 16S/23S rRNA (cytidine-2'-O)-methyltransferase TlyA [Acidimicrobiia bacterium]
MRRKLVASRSAARRAISQGRVRVGRVAEPKASTLVAPGDPLDLVGEPERFVGRGGYKLDHAIEHFAIPVSGRRAIDVGASTGGFSDCLLQRGAISVVALDVGYGQLHHRLRNDDRVEVVERTNIRHADAEQLGAPFDLVVADLSFISMQIVAPALSGLGADGTDWVLLVKPQFEVGKKLVGSGGVVSDPEVHRRAIELAVHALEISGVGAIGVVASPITGAEGNREFLVHARRGPCALDAGTVRHAVTGEELT